MKTFDVELEGITPLLHHRMSEEELFKLLGSKAGKKKIKEDLTPREIAEKYAYKNPDGTYYIPLDYVCGAFAYAASDYKQSNSSRKSYKSVAMGIFRPVTPTAPLLDKENRPIDQFEVDIRKATNHQKGAVAVCRPRFEQWKTRFKIALDESIISPDIALQILQDAGRRAGIGSFRVCKGGYFGQFSVTRWQEAN